MSAMTEAVVATIRQSTITDRVVVLTATRIRIASFIREMISPARRVRKKVSGSPSK